MSIHHLFFNSVVATLLWCGVAAAQTAELDSLFDRLAQADPSEAEGIRGQIETQWSRSGSPAMDLLLRRGEDALADGNPALAVDHLSALIDHAPDFAQGYSLRASAFYAQEQIGLALDDLRTALELNPRHFNAMRGLAVILQQLDRPQEALEVYQRIRDIAPHIDGVDMAIDRLSVELDGTSL
ncbi:tetratricopeptide repeat protein [Loktanella sp. TSTF-M6]|uniref:Tetratricopeptide repeat protein n=1 Tax=Loktanella gaetbuli TaxID=2881335 RepID=A0ABS8BS20_9RHOB|nr:tetratricopeptide repeat protein [Loktanella gaetbuli]MCB5198529.1 tetratricopeptide repeat protein [Loktanella gaetbuli]